MSKEEPKRLGYYLPEHLVADDERTQAVNDLMVVVTNEVLKLVADMEAVDLANVLLNFASEVVARTLHVWFDPNRWQQIIDEVIVKPTLRRANIRRVEQIRRENLQ